MMKVGFIGLGAMGKPMAKNLVKAGYETIVFDVRQEPMAELEQLGAEKAESPKELAIASEVVITMVRDDTETEAVMYNKSGVLEGAKSGSTIMITSTVTPSLCQRLAKDAAKTGVGVLDAPVSGAAAGAEAGTLTFMVGGDENAFRKVRPVLEAMGKNVFYFGSIGSGEVAKLANNIILMDHFFAATEGLAFAIKAGIKLDKILEMVKRSTGNSWVIEHWDVVTAMRQQRRAGGRAFDLIYKDARLALEYAKTIDMELPLLSTCLKLDICEFPD